ncbi:hypothetical protein ACFQVC_40550, partial [Streptomyces monticola]
VDRVLLAGWLVLVDRVLLAGWLVLVDRVLLAGWLVLVDRVLLAGWLVLVDRVLLAGWPVLVGRMLLADWLVLVGRVSVVCSVVMLTPPSLLGPGGVPGSSHVLFYGCGAMTRNAAAGAAEASGRTTYQSDVGLGGAGIGGVRTGLPSGLLEL